MSDIHCFRQEAGAYGKYSKGLRVHEFSKVEMFIYCLPEESQNARPYSFNGRENLSKSQSSLLLSKCARAI
jgi:seryl-tRNA synthetase